jgi:hypothetical protein
MSRRDTNQIAQFLHLPLTLRSRVNMPCLTALQPPVDISPVLDPQDFYRSSLVIYVVEYPDICQSSPARPRC